MNYLLKGCSLLAIASLGVSPSLADGHGDKATDEVVVKGKVLYSDQVNALKTPTPIVDIPQSAQITTSAEIFDRGFDEIGDIIFVLTCLCNQMEINLENCIIDSSEKKAKRDSERHKKNKKLK